jgi:hypothetical protein
MIDASQHVASIWSSVLDCGYQGSQYINQSELTVQCLFSEPTNVCKRTSNAGKRYRSFQWESVSCASQHQPDNASSLVRRQNSISHSGTSRYHRYMLVCVSGRSFQTALLRPNAK